MKEDNQKVEYEDIRGLGIVEAIKRELCSNMRHDTAVTLLRHAKDVLESVAALHKPYKIYDECEHDHYEEYGDGPGPEGEDPNGVVDVDGIGLTCNHTYSICAACCTDDGQTEYCAGGHDHGKDKPICPTMALFG